MIIAAFTYGLLEGDLFQKYIRLATSTVVGFAGKSVWPRGKIRLPFTVEDYRGSVRKTILEEFQVI